MQVLILCVCVKVWSGNSWVHVWERWGERCVQNVQKRFQSKYQQMFVKCVFFHHVQWRWHSFNFKIQDNAKNKKDKKKRCFTTSLPQVELGWKGSISFIPSLCQTSKDLIADDTEKTAIYQLANKFRRNAEACDMPYWALRKWILLYFVTTIYCNFTNFRCSFIFGIFGGQWFYRS